MQIGFGIALQSTSEQARSEHRRTEAAMEIYVMRDGKQSGPFSPHGAQAQIDTVQL